MVNLYAPLDEIDMKITSDYRLPKRPDHFGIDYGNQSFGHNIYSSTDGWVICSGITGGYGNTIVIKHRDGTSTLYGHMKDLSEFKIGDYVGVRKKIGEVGNTGTSSAPHLHFEHIDKEGTKQIKGHRGRNDALGLTSRTHRLNPHDNFKEIGGYFIWWTENAENNCENCLARNGKLYKYGEDIEPPLHPNCKCTINPILNPYNYEYMLASRNFENSLLELKRYINNIL